MADFKCYECGATFDEPIDLDYGMSGCPECGGAYGYTEVCLGKGCYGDFLPEELFGGYCKNCLYDKLTIQTTLDYMTDCDILVDFMFDKVFDCDPPKHPTQKLKQHLRSTYLATAKIPDGNQYLMSLATNFIFDDEAGMEDFADWLQKKVKSA